MGITVTHVRDDFNSASRGYIKILVVGQPGSGKTMSASTWPNVLFADAEGGLLSVRNRDVRSTKITSLADIDELRSMLGQKPKVRAEMLGGPVDTLVVDTVDEIARIIIRERLRTEKHEVMEMRDWGYLGDTLRAFVRGYRNLDLNVVFNVHVKSSEDAATGRVEYKPAIQGAMGDELAGYVDIAALLVARPVLDPLTNERVIRRHLQTFPDVQHDWLKDRSGMMPLEFEINLTDDYERLATTIFGSETERQAVVAAEAKPVITKAKVRKKAEPEPPPPAPEPPEPELPPAAAGEAPVVEAVPEVGTEPVGADPDPMVVDLPVVAVAADPPARAALADLEPEPEPEPSPAPDPLAELGTLPVCSECGVPVSSRDHADFSVIRFQTVLCREHFAARNAQKSRR